MKKLFCLPVILFMLNGIFSCTNIKINPDITEKELFNHIHFLAGDSLKGRYPGTPEDKIAAEYIADMFKQAGLELLYNNGLQAFEVITAIKTGPNNILNYKNETFKINENFVPLSFSASEKVEAEIVFAGYGFNVNEKQLKWNDYENIDVDGKLVLLLRGEPDDSDLEKSLALYSGLRSKAITAKDQGAAGIIFVSGPEFDPADELLKIDKPEGRLDIPVIQIKRTVADKILSANHTTIENLENELHQKKSSISFYLNEKILLQTDIESDPKVTYNIAARINNSKNQNYIVIGAHYDHLGFGGLGTGSRNPNIEAIHFGADDNASGVASMLEIAQKLESKKDSLNTNFIFAAFGAEEMGLLGSKHFISNLPVPDTLISAMINIDMVGRLKDDRSLQIGGIGTSLEGDSILKSLNSTYNFKLGLSQEGYGPSDHSSFYSKNIPVFFYSTGAHIDYHTPNDTLKAIKFNGLAEVSNYIYDLAFNLSSQKTQLTFQEAGPKIPDGDYNRNKLKVTLGIMPDFSGVEKRGLRADLVIKDKPANKAGMKSGDVIVAMDGLPVGDVYEYMERLNKLKAGQIITVEVIRNNEKKVLIVQL